MKPGLAAILLMSGGGCVGASLASSTGPRPAGRAWSVAGRQQVHVGEEVQFDFVLTDAWGRFASPLGRADYCAAEIGRDRLEVEPDDRGHFRFAYRMDRLGPGESLKVRATAYRQRGRRDFVNVRGEWIAADPRLDEPDQKVAADALRLTAYQSKIELTLDPAADDFDAESGLLRLRRPDGAATNVYPDRPDRRGFAFLGPDARGQHRVTYEPAGDEVNPTGVTEVEFSVYDVSGRRHWASGALPTP